MNTTKQMVTENSGNFAIHGSLVSRAERNTSVLAPHDVTRKHRHSAVLIFGGIALVAYPLGRALAGLPHQEFEGLGVAACFFVYAGIFLWRMNRAMTQESLRAETLNESVTRVSEPNALQVEHAATQPEPGRK
jgi:hypothetical protein